MSNKSLRALAIEVRLEMSGGTPTDDSRFSIRHIESEIKHVHSQVQREIDLTNELLGIIPDATRVQIFPCIPLVDADDFYCKCTASGGKLKKSKLPTFYQWRGQSYLTYLGNTGMDIPFTPMTSMSAINAFGDAIKRPSYFIAGGNAYVSLPVDYALMCEITIMGIPEDPTATDGKCFDAWSADWAVPEYVKAAIKERVMARLGNNLLATGATADMRNNSQHGNQAV